MKKFTSILFLTAYLAVGTASAQRPINDRSIRYQQERMVFKQWDKGRFSPEPGFLYTNPLYWMTWALHPNYPKTDLRPLSPSGPQTQRLGLVLAMQRTSEAYKMHADTLSNTALSEATNYFPLFSTVDPLWQWYYRHEFAPLLSGNSEVMAGSAIAERNYLERTGVADWYRNESAAIHERLEAAMGTMTDRGSRIMAYYRLLKEYRQLLATWEAKKQYARKFLSLKRAAGSIRENPDRAVKAGGRSDRQIAENIVRNSKL